MSRDTNKNKNIQRRSALSFIGGDDTIDDYIDHLMQSQSWRNTDEIENSDIGLIQKVLNEFDEKVTQEKKLKIAKARSRKKSTRKSTTEDSTAPPSNSEASSSNSNTSVSKSKVETKEKAASTKRDRKPSARKSLQPSIDDTKKAVRKTSESSANEIADNESIRKTNMKEATITIGKEIATDNLMTSSSEASSSNMHSNTSVSKSKVETKEKATSTKRDRKSSARKSLQPSTDDTKKAVRKTSESSANEIADNESIRKTNMKEATIMIDKEIATDNLMTSNFEGSSSNIHSNTSVPKVETREKKTLTKRASKAIKKTSPRENLQHNTDDTKKAVRRASDSSVKEIAVNESLRKKILKKVPTNTSDIKLLTSTPKTSSTRKGTVKDKKSIVEKGELKMTNSENKPKEHVKRKKKQKCAGNTKLEQQLTKQLKAIKQEERKERKKNKKTAKAMDKLSRKISGVKKRIECIKYDLESDDSDSTSDSDSSSDYSESSSCSSSCYSECSTDCDCTRCENYSDDFTEDSTTSGSESTFDSKSDCNCD